MKSNNSPTGIETGGRAEVVSNSKQSEIIESIRPHAALQTLNPNLPLPYRYTNNTILHHRAISIHPHQQ
jgi:hypothetical protein